MMLADFTYNKPLNIPETYTTFVNVHGIKNELM